MKDYDYEIHLTDNASVGLFYKGKKAVDGTRLFTIQLSIKGDGVESKQFVDLPEGRLVDLKNLIDYALTNFTLKAK